LSAEPAKLYYPPRLEVQSLKGSHGRTSGLPAARNVRQLVQTRTRPSEDTDLITRNAFGAAALAAALVFSPLMSAAPAAAAARALSPRRRTTRPHRPSRTSSTAGRALFAKGQYEQAATVFRDFLKGHPDSFIADLMLLWLGRSYIEFGKFQEADQVAQRLRTIKDTPFVDIYESELTAAKRDRPATAAASPTPRPQATPVETAAARPTPTPTRTVPALVRPAPTRARLRLLLRRRSRATTTLRRPASPCAAKATPSDHAPLRHARAATIATGPRMLSRRRRTCHYERADRDAHAASDAAPDARANAAD
jgi:tetratricopeptide (TPR) repeat protein